MPLHALLVHALLLASWCRGPHCTIHIKLHELELLLLLLSLLAYYLAAWVLKPKCAC